MNILEIIKLSIENLLNFKLRTFLTMLGIILGISSVVLITSLGAGFQGKILDDITSIAQNIILVEPKSYDNISQKELFIENDIKKIKNIPNVSNVSPSIITFFKEANENDYISTHVVNKDAMDIENLQITYGRPFNDIDFENPQNLILLDRLSAQKKYKTEKNAIGKIINLVTGEGSVKPFKIIGIFKSKDEEVSKLSPYTTIYMTEKEYNVITNSNSVYEMLQIKIKDNKQMENTVKYLKSYLKFKNKKDDFYEIKPLSKEISRVTGVFDKITMFISLIASISIIVGGVGVMNIMLVSVKERVTEIGLRKAIGATNKQILSQFLFETVILTVLGGIIGLVFGYSIAFIIGIFVKIIPILKIKILIISLSVSTITGIIFGIYPAKQAAKLSPIEALRKE